MNAIQTAIRLGQERPLVLYEEPESGVESQMDKSEHYGEPVLQFIAPKERHFFSAASTVTYNFSGELSLKDKIQSIARQVCSVCTGKVTIVLDDPSSPPYAEVEMYGNSSIVLNEWLKLILALKQCGVQIPVFPVILGQNDLSPEEFGTLLGYGMAEMGVLLQTEERIDVVELLKRDKGL